MLDLEEAPVLKKRPVSPVNSMYTWSKYSGIQPFWEFPKTGEYASFLSLEIECENVNYASNIIKKFDFLTSEEDNSLRLGGREFINNIPLQLKDYHEKLPVLFEELQKQQVQFSHRTSIHVHNNVLFKTRVELNLYVLMYFLVEPQLYAFAGRDRKYSNFCVPNSSLLRLFHGWEKFKSFPKYCGLSGCRFQDLGTLEWRHFPGTFDVKKLLQWLEMITLLDLYTNKIKLSSDKEYFKLEEYWLCNPNIAIEEIRKVFPYIEISEQDVAYNSLVYQGML